MPRRLGHVPAGSSSRAGGSSNLVDERRREYSCRWRSPAAPLVSEVADAIPFCLVQSFDETTFAVGGVAQAEFGGTAMLVDDGLEPLDRQLAQRGPTRVGQALGLGEERVRQIDGGPHAHKHTAKYALMHSRSDTRLRRDTAGRSSGRAGRTQRHAQSSGSAIWTQFRPAALARYIAESARRRSVLSRRRWVPPGARCSR